MGEIARKLGLRIKELRAKQGLTQLKLAEIVDMEASNLSKIERGIQIPKEESLDNISKALNVEVKELFDYTENINKQDLILKINTLLENSNEENLQRFYRILINL